MKKLKYLLFLALSCATQFVLAQGVVNVGSGGGVADSTRLTQDSIMVYYQGGVEIGRDTISVTGTTTQPAGSNGQIQFNVSGAFGASSLLTYSTADSSFAINGIKIWKGRWGKSANTAVGENTLTGVTTGTGNTAIGSNALRDNTIGVANTAVGYQALLANTLASNNCALGYRALYSTNDGGYNVAMGAQAMSANTSGGYNAAFGYHALYSNTTGNQNTALGYQAGRYITGSSENTSANNSVFVGAATKAAAINQTNQIVIGHGATGLGDSTAVLGAAMKKVRLGDNLTFKTDQTIGAGQDNYVLTYDHSAGTVSLEASAGGVSDGDKGDIDVTASGTIWTIDTSAVTSLKILDSTIITADIADNAITGAKIAASTIDSTDIATGGIGNTDLAAGIVTTSKIASSAVDSTKIAPNSVGASELISTAVTPGSYTNTNLTVDADGRITAASSGSEVDGSVTNEGALSVGAAGANTSQIATNTSGDGGVILKGGTGITLSESVDTITITATGTSPAGSNTQIQFNNSGSFGASSALTWNGNILTAQASGSNTFLNGGSATWSGTGQNTCIGTGSGAALTTGFNNAFFGRATGSATTTGAQNVGFGTETLVSNTTGNSNIAVGVHSLRYGTTFENNVGIGLRAGMNITGNNNTIIGTQSLYYATSSSANVAIGGSAGQYIADGVTTNTDSDNSVFIGYNSRPNAVGETNQIVVGHNAVGAGSNTATFGNTSITKTILMGAVGIGTTSPDRLLHPEVSDAVTNAVTYAQRNTHITSGTATTGFGVGTEQELEDAAGNNEVAATQEVTWSDATNASEDATYLIKQMKAGTLDTTLLITSTGNVAIGGNNPTPARTLHVAGEARITDLTTDTPTRIVGADADGDLGAITVGSGLNLSGGTLTATGGVAEDSLVVGHVPYVSAANTIQTDPAGDADAMAYDNSLNILTVKRIKLKGGSGTSTQLLGRNTSDYNVNGITVGANLTLSSNILSAKDTVYINLIAAKPGVAVTQTAGHDYYDATFLVPEYLNGFDLARVDYAMTNSTATTGSWTVGIRLMSTTNTSVTSNGCAATFNAGDVRASSSGGLTVSKNQWLYIETNTAIAGTLDGTNEGLLATLMFVK